MCVCVIPHQLRISITYPHLHLNRGVFFPLFFSDSLVPPLHGGGPGDECVLSVAAVHLFLLSSAPAVMRTSVQTFKDPSFE